MRKRVDEKIKLLSGNVHNPCDFHTTFLLVYCFLSIDTVKVI